MAREAHPRTPRHDRCERDGSVRIRITVSDTAALVRWVLGLGRAAEIVDPPALRAAEREMLLAVREAHGAPPVPRVAEVR